MPAIEANGQTLHYEIHGEGEPLLCVMGLSMDKIGWALQLGPFSERYRTIVFDNRDVGRSSRATGDYEIRDMAADTLALADALGIGSFHLLGMSMGGMIGQEVALAAPERVRTLTLAVTLGGGGRWQREFSRIWGAQALRTPPEDHVDLLLLQCFTEAFVEDVERMEQLRQASLANPYAQEPEAFARQLGACGRHEARDRLGALRMPVHVIGAERDTLVPVWKSKELAELIPDAQLTIVEGAPHGVNWERPQEFTDAVLAFLAEHAGTDQRDSASERTTAS